MNALLFRYAIKALVSDWPYNRSFSNHKVQNTHEFHIRPKPSEPCQSDSPVQLIQDGRCEIVRDTGAASVSDVFPLERRRVVETLLVYQSQLQMVILVVVGLVQLCVQVRLLCRQVHLYSHPPGITP